MAPARRRSLVGKGGSDASGGGKGRRGSGHVDRPRRPPRSKRWRQLPLEHVPLQWRRQSAPRGVRGAPRAPLRLRPDHRPRRRRRAAPARPVPPRRTQPPTMATNVRAAPATRAPVARGGDARDGGPQGAMDAGSAMDEVAAGDGADGAGPSQARPGCCGMRRTHRPRAVPRAIRPAGRARRGHRRWDAPGAVPPMEGTGRRRAVVAVHGMHAHNERRAGRRPRGGPGHAGRCVG